MIRRTIEIASAAHLRVNLNQLIIRNDEGEHSVSFEDIGFLILDNHQITCSQSVFRRCAEQNVAVVVTDEKHLPASLLLHLDVHSTQAKIMRMQVSTPERVRHVVWQQIIEAKIKAQATVLEAVRGMASARLSRLAKTVQPADVNNHEAQASRIYFKALFGQDFKRDYNSPSSSNVLLNYGYSLIRTACARALVGAGLHPAFGVHHHNQYNVFCLADDVMEPLRPLVDKRVAKLSPSDVSKGLDRNVKNNLLEVLSASVLLKERKLPLMSALTTYCASLRKVLETRKGGLNIPVIV